MYIPSMEIWILIYLMQANGVIETGHIEFNSKQTCEEALVEMKKLRKHTDGVCVKK
jgi:hypothetical protein